jgi:hypothetical protein
MSGGLNLKSSPLGLSPEWLIEAQNVEYVTAGARSKRKGQQKINSTGLVEASPSTTVDQDSASGQKILYVAATTGLGAGDYVAIAQGTAREEHNKVSSIQAGVSLTLENNLTNTHTAAQADSVKKSAAVTGYLDFIKNNEQQIQIVGASNGKLYTEGGGTLSERATGLTTGTDVLWTMTVFKDNAILANAQDRPRYTADGVTYTEISDASLPQQAHIPSVWRNRLWMADGDTLYYSSLDSFTDWTTTGGNIPIHGGKGPITALIPFYQYLVVAKADFIAVITGSTPSDFAIRPLVEGVGISGPFAWARVGNDALFISLEEVRSLATVEDAGELKHTALSSPIEPYMRDEVNPNRRRYIQCALYSAKQQLYIAHADRNSTIENKAVVLDMLTGSWSVYTPLLAHILATKRTSLGHRQLIAGGHDGFLRLLDSSDADDGAGISTIFKTPHLDLGRPNMPKGWRKLILFGKARGATLLVDYEIDFQPAGSLSVQVQGFGDPLGSVSGSFTLGSSTLGGGEAFNQEEFLLEGSGHFISLKFTNTGANQPFTLLGLGLEAMLEGTDKWAP